MCLGREFSFAAFGLKLYIFDGSGSYGVAEASLIQVIIEILKHRPQVCPAVVAASCPDLTYAPAKASTVC